MAFDYMKLHHLTITLAAWSFLVSAARAEDAPARSDLEDQGSPTRTLVWAKPGEDGTARSPDNWTEYASAADYTAKPSILSTTSI